MDAIKIFVTLLVVIAGSFSTATVAWGKLLLGNQNEIRDIYVLIDTSASYLKAGQDFLQEEILHSVEEIIDELKAGDYLIIRTISENSITYNNHITKVDLSNYNKHKKELSRNPMLLAEYKKMGLKNAEKINEKKAAAKSQFNKRIINRFKNPVKKTDIKGAIASCQKHLSCSHTDHKKFIIIYSDLIDDADLENEKSLDLSGTTVIARYVIKPNASLLPDNLKKLKPVSYYETLKKLWKRQLKVEKFTLRTADAELY